MLEETDQLDFNSLFDIQIVDRPRPEYELPLVITFFRDPHDFRSKTFVLRAVKRTVP